MEHNTMKMQTSVTTSVKINNVQHKQVLTIDWTGMSSDQLQALAQRSLVIRKQDADRRNGRIPPEKEEIKATNYALGVRLSAPQETLQEMLEKLSVEERAKLLGKYLSGDFDSRELEEEEISE